MEFHLSDQFKNTSWWLETVFYAFWTVLIVVVFSYGIFTAKVWLQEKRMGQVDAKLAQYGSEEQKEIERKVFGYKKKIDDFNFIVNNYKISSNIFSFIEENTLGNVWFNNFSMSQSSNEIRLSGEAENMEALSRQSSIFEASDKYVKNIVVLNSQVGPNGKIKFIINLSLELAIFSYVPEELPPDSENALLNSVQN
jgi:hypothetical protein